MILSVYNISDRQIDNMIHCEFVLNQNTMTEQLICNNHVIYEAPICTCLTCFLSDNMSEMEILTKKPINRIIASILKKFDVVFGNDELISDDIYNETITAKLLGMDSIDEVYSELNKDETVDLDRAYSTTQNIMTTLSCYEQMFSRDACWDVEDKKTQHDVLKEIMIEYVANLSVDPLCKELSFFHHIFGNGAFYSDPYSSVIDLYYSKRSELSSEFLFRYLRETYISLHQGQSRYIVNNYQDICVMTLYFALQNNLTINKCKNCGKYFIPLSRSDEMYCDNPSPKDPAKTCKQYGKTTGSYEKIQSDPVLRMCRNLYNAKQMLVRRNPDIRTYSENFERFKQDSAEWKRKYASHICTSDEFAQWLTVQKGKKT